MTQKREAKRLPYKQKSAEPLFSQPFCVIMTWVMKMDKEKELPKKENENKILREIVL